MWIKGKWNWRPNQAEEKNDDRMKQLNKWDKKKHIERIQKWMFFFFFILVQKIVYICLSLELKMLNLFVAGRWIFPTSFFSYDCWGICDFFARLLPSFRWVSFLFWLFFPIFLSREHTNEYNHLQTQAKCYSNKQRKMSQKSLHCFVVPSLFLHNRIVICLYTFIAYILHIVTLKQHLFATNK